MFLLILSLSLILLPSFQGKAIQEDVKADRGRERERERTPAERKEKNRKDIIGFFCSEPKVARIKMERSARREDTPLHLLPAAHRVLQGTCAGGGGSKTAYLVD